MAPHEPAQPSRRSAFALLGAASVTAGSVTAGSVLASPAAASAARAGRVPKELLPGGEFDAYLARRVG
jgi:hypothetical protein